MPHYQASIIAHSISPDDVELLTYELVYPRYIHAEAKTHRRLKIGSAEYEFMQEVGIMDDPALSRNASSSRAIPTSKLIEMVARDPVKPLQWGRNQRGMQAGEALSADEISDAITIWGLAAEDAARSAEALMLLGVHKQWANRLLEPFLPIRVVCTATEWENFFELRRHDDAQPEIHHLANLMWDAKAASTPRPLDYDEWHLPYVSDEEILNFGGRTDPTGVLRKISAARCARVSYRTHDGLEPRLREDIDLYERLVGSAPLHASPVEHQAKPDTLYTFTEGSEAWDRPELHGNFCGWIQARKLIERVHLQ